MTVFTIAKAEWLLWRRSNVAISGIVLVAIIIGVISIINATSLMAEAHQRQHQQAVSEDTFLDQPDRHPHRMVHYGHYVFRTPPSLSIFDTGVDSVTGQSIFLEGHRQNSATFASAGASADVGSFQNNSPAFVYQVLLPLLLITLGSGVLVREREAKTLKPMIAQGLSGTSIYFGKWLALAALSGAMLVPMMILVGISMMLGETLSIGIVMCFSYLLYLLIWTSVISLVSGLARHQGTALSALIAVWLVWALIIPRIAVTSASAVHAVPGKIAVDYQMYADLRKLGDGHNASDPAFARLKRDLLAQYNVDSVDELPINFRGKVAQTSEAELTAVMNRYSNERMAAESAQSDHANQYGWLSPTLAITTVSRLLSGTDLATHHRFLVEAEQLRYDFVQGLNESHINTLNYTDDINRNQNAEASRRARISAENWQVLERFEFVPNAPFVRITQAFSSFSMLCSWLVALILAGVLFSRRLAQ